MVQCGASERLKFTAFVAILGETWDQGAHTPGSRLRYDLYCVEWNVKLLDTIGLPYLGLRPPLKYVNFILSNV